MDLPSRYTWRPLEATDVDAIVDLYARWDEHHDLPFRGDRAEVEHDLADDSGDVATRSISAWDESGTLQGLGWVFRRDRQGVRKHRALVWVIVDPDHAELESTLIEWCDRTATPLLLAAPDDAPLVLRAWSPAHIVDRIARFEGHGYTVARYFSSLSRPVAGAAPAEPPAGVELVAWDRDEHDRAAFDAHVEAFADHWGSVPPDWEKWIADHVEESHTRLDLSVVAVAEGEVVGYSLNQVWPEDAKVRGLTEGYIGALGVKRAWRRQGIATALILDSIRRFTAEGFDNASLDVDAESETGAVGLYERLSFEVVDSSVALVKDVPRHSN